MDIGKQGPVQLDNQIGHTTILNNRQSQIRPFLLLRQGVVQGIDGQERGLRVDVDGLGIFNNLIGVGAGSGSHWLWNRFGKLREQLQRDARTKCCARAGLRQSQDAINRNSKRGGSSLASGDNADQCASLVNQRAAAGAGRYGCGKPQQVEA